MNKNSNSISVSVTVLSQLFLYLKSLKVDVDDFLRSLSLEPGMFQAPDQYIPVDIYLHIQEEAVRFTKDPFFGLHMGEYFEPGAWSILGYLMMNCKTLGEAFEKSTRYSRIIGNMIESKVEFSPGKIKIIVYTSPQTPKMSRHCFESMFSSIVRMMRNLTGQNISPLEINFIYPSPQDTNEYQRIFCCPVFFDQEENSMTIDENIIYTPVLLANPGLLEHFEKYARDFIIEMGKKDENTQAVTKIILAHLDDEHLTIEKVAAEMSLSVRTLQMRLEKEGVIFSDLLKDIRKRLATKYLQENYTVEQITYMLGFSNPSVFRKAFKKWAGVTPREYRQGFYMSGTVA